MNCSDSCSCLATSIDSLPSSPSIHLPLLSTHNRAPRLQSLHQPNTVNRSIISRRRYKGTAGYRIVIKPWCRHFCSFLVVLYRFSHNNNNMSSSWLLIHRLRSFHAVRKLERCSTATLTSQRSYSPRIRHRVEIPSEPRSYRITRIRLSTSKSSSLSASLMGNNNSSDDADMAAVVATSLITSTDSKSKPHSKARSQRTTKRSLSSSADTEVNEGESVNNEVDLVSTTASSTSLMKANKTNQNKTESVASKPATVKSTKVQPKASTPSTYRGSKQTTVSKFNKTADMVTPETSPTSFGVDESSFIHQPHVNITGIMTSSYATAYLENATTIPENETTPTSPFSDNKVSTINHNNQLLSQYNVNSYNVNSCADFHNSSISTQLEYVVLSRTPIPTNKPNDGISSNNDSSIPTLATNEETLLNPYDLIPPNATTGEWKIPYPKALSPSSIKEFQSCPQSFLFQYVLGLRQPTTTILAKGTMCHSALERIFDIEPHDRSLSVLQNLFRTAWSEQRTTDTYRLLFEEDVMVDELQKQLSEERIQDDVDTNSPRIVDGDISSHIPFMQPMLERRRYIQKEITWGLEGLALLQNYWMAEDASSILRPNPVQREVWVKSNLPLILNADDSVVKIDEASTRTITSNETAPNVQSIENDDSTSTVHTVSMFLENTTLINSTGRTNIDADNSTDEDDSTLTTVANFDNSNITKFLVRGIVDRLDMVQDPNNKSQISLRLIDYKSGKAPDLKYSPSMNLKIQNEAFDQLLIYALLLRESNKNKIKPMPLRYLRLFYLTSIHDQKATYWDMDLGETQEERDAILRTVHVSLSNVYRNICQMIDSQDFKIFKGCQRSFCYCHKCRPKFQHGTVWEPTL